MVANKLSAEDVKEIQRRLKEGVSSKELAERYGVHQTTIYDRAKYGLKAEKIPLEMKNKVIQAIRQGHTKAEAAQMYDLNIGTVYCFTKGICSGYDKQGNHIIRQNGIKLLNRLMNDGCLISDFVVNTVRGLQRNFPMIRTARFKEKTIFYLEGREDETIEAFFREQPEKIINYSTIKEISVLLGVETSRKHQKSIIDKYKMNHDAYWRARRRRQKKLEDIFNPNSLGKLSWDYFRYL